MNGENEIFRWMMKHNLNWVALFHNHIDAVLKEKVNEIPTLEDLEEKNKTYWKNIFEENFPECASSA